MTSHRFTGHLAFYDLLKEILDAVNEALGETPTGKPDRACVVPGQIAWDECECGQLAGTVNQWFFSDTFPIDATPGAIVSPQCRSAWEVAEMLIEILRCAPQPKGEDLAPDCSALDAAAQTHITDADVVRNTIVCLLEEMKDAGRIVDYTIGAQVAVGPQGMCVGTDITFSVALDRTE